jgi:nicotinate-nucleotide adenylyltransferase
MTRPGFELADASHCPWAVPRITKEKTALRSSVSGKIYFAAVTPQPISATDVRARRQRGEPIEGLVPKAVADYIDQHHLYRT